MRGTAKFLVLLLSVQAVCLGIGIWVQHQFERWSLRQSAVHRAVTLLGERGQHVFALAAQSNQVDRAASPTTTESWPEVLRLAADHALACLVVDTENRVLAACDAAGRIDDRVDLTAPLELRPIRHGKSQAAGIEWVEFEQPDGAHIAADVSDASRPYRLIVHEPKVVALARADELAQSLTQVQWLSLGWILIISTVAFYTMMSRFLGHLTRERRRSGGRYLRHGDAVVRTRDAVIFGLAKLAESRDPDTGEHLERITSYARMLARSAQTDPRFNGQITPVFVRNIGLSAALHDIGKVGIQDRVLLKRGPLTLDERAHMQSHVIVGGQCLRDIERRLGSSNFLQMAREIALCHHECWDGSGYPEGLSGAAIPLAARIVAIVDFYDALSMRRVYKEAFPHERCKRMILEESGRRFDPALVEVWMTIEHRFETIANRFRITEGKSVADAESTAQQAELQWETLPIGTSP